MNEVQREFADGPQGSPLSLAQIDGGDDGLGEPCRRAAPEWRCWTARAAAAPRSRWSS